MATTSQIRFILNKKDFIRLQKFWEERLNTNDIKTIKIDIKKDVNIFEEHLYNNKVYFFFGYNDIKWFSTSWRVRTFKDFFDILEAEGCSYRYIEIYGYGEGSDYSCVESDNFPILKLETQFRGDFIGR